MPQVKHESNDADEDGGFLHPGIFGRQKALRDAEKLLEEAEKQWALGNRNAAKTHAVKVLQTAQEGGWGIWGNLKLPRFDGEVLRGQNLRNQDERNEQSNQEGVRREFSSSSDRTLEEQRQDGWFHAIPSEIQYYPLRCCLKMITSKMTAIAASDEESTVGVPHPSGDGTEVHPLLHEFSRPSVA